MTLPCLFFVQPLLGESVKFQWPIQEELHLVPFILLGLFWLTILLWLWPVKSPLVDVYDVLTELEIDQADCLYLTNSSTYLPFAANSKPWWPIPWMAQIHKRKYSAVVINQGDEDEEYAFHMLKSRGFFITIKNGSVVSIIKKP